MKLRPLMFLICLIGAGSQVTESAAFAAHQISRYEPEPVISDQMLFMVEGSRIDYGGHDNDAGAMLNEILDFDAALGAGIVFQRAHPETLIIVTADHGTGGFTFTYGKFDGQPEAQVLHGVPRRSPRNTGTIREKAISYP